MMIVQKPADQDPAMKSALKNHIMRKRQQLKQELEQDAIEKRLKREQDAKRKQDAMTLDQLKEQLSQLEKTLDNLKNEKHILFAQLKQNMRVLNEDDTRRKQKEGELNAARQQQNEQNEQNRQQQQQKHSVVNVPPQSSISNQENHVPPPALREKSQNQEVPAQQSHIYPIQPSNHHEPDTLSANSHPPSNHVQRSNSIFNSAAFSHLLNAHSFPRQSPYLTHPLQPNRSSNPYGPMAGYSPLGHHQPPSLISGHGIPTSLSHGSQPNPLIRPSPSQMTNNALQLNSGPPKMPLSMPITSSGPPTPLDFNPNLVTSTAHQIQQQAINNSAAAAAAALGLPYGSPYFNSNTPIGPPLTTHQAIEHHMALNAAAASNLNHLSGNGNNSSMGGNSNNNGSNNSSRGNPLPPLKRPISATNLTNEALSPNKKIHTQPPPQNQQPQHQLSAPLSNPYLAYPGLPPGLGSASGPSLQASLFGGSLIRTPPPSNISSLFNSAAFSHLLNFPRQSPYLTHLQQANRAASPYGPMASYPPLGHHPPASLISGHGIPTSLSHVPQPNQMIRPSPSQLTNNSLQLNTGPPKMPLSLPTSSGPPTPMDFNPNLVTSTAHQMQQQALNNSAAAAAAALGIPYGSPYFSAGSPIGPPITSHQVLEHHAALNAAAVAAAAAASNHNLLSGNNPNGGSNNNIKNRVAPYQ